jgi:hypothetical protein
MKIVPMDMSRFQVDEKQRGSQWSDTLDQFLTRLNPSRVQAGYEPLTHSQLGKKLSDADYTTAHDAYRLYRACERANHFSKLFWYKLRPSSHDRRC